MGTDAWDRINVQGTRRMLAAAQQAGARFASFTSARKPPVAKKAVGSLRGQGDPNRGSGFGPSAAAFQLHPQSSQHALPLIPSIPSLVMIGTITSPATGSAQIGRASCRERV